MARSFENSIDNYDILYCFNTEPYKPRSSWTTSTTFVPDTELGKQEFIPEPVLEKSEFILNPVWCR